MSKGAHQDDTHSSIFFYHRANEGSWKANLYIYIYILYGAQIKKPCLGGFFSPRIEDIHSFQVYLHMIYCSLKLGGLFLYILITFSFFFKKRFTASTHIYIYIYLEPQTSIYQWLFQLDDSNSLHRKWLFHQTSILKWLFRVPGIYIYI